MHGCEMCIGLFYLFIYLFIYFLTKMYFFICPPWVKVDYFRCGTEKSCAKCTVCNKDNAILSVPSVIRKR